MNTDSLTITKTTGSDDAENLRIVAASALTGKYWQNREVHLNHSQPFIGSCHSIPTSVFVVIVPVRSRVPVAIPRPVVWINTTSRKREDSHSHDHPKQA